MNPPHQQCLTVDTPWNQGSRNHVSHILNLNMSLLQNVHLDLWAIGRIWVVCSNSLRLPTSATHQSPSGLPIPSSVVSDPPQALPEPPHVNQGLQNLSGDAARHPALMEGYLFLP